MIYLISFLFIHVVPPSLLPFLSPILPRPRSSPPPRSIQVFPKFRIAPDPFLLLNIYKSHPNPESALAQQPSPPPSPVSVHFLCITYGPSAQILTFMLTSTLVHNGTNMVSPSPPWPRSTRERLRGIVETGLISNWHCGIPLGTCSGCTKCPLHESEHVVAFFEGISVVFRIACLP